MNDGTATLRVGDRFRTDAAGKISYYYFIDKFGELQIFRPNAVWHRMGRRKLDLVSCADFILNGTICWPFTLFEGVHVLPPGADITITRGSIDVQHYFLPEETSKQKPDLNAWGRRLRESVENVLADQLKELRRIKVMFSGGEDSRAVASLVSRDLDVELVTLADGDNREVALARRAAHALGHTFRFVARPEGFYREALRERIRLIGPGLDIAHTHVFGPTAAPFRSADALVGGYAADTLFKTAWMANIRHRRARPDRLDERYPDHPVGIRSARRASWLSPEIAAAVEERRLQHHRRVQEFRPRSAGNWHTLWPLGAQRVAFAHHLACQSIGPRVVEPFLDDRLYRLAAEMPDELRVDRRAFRAAFARAMGSAGWLPTSSHSVPRLGGQVGHSARSLIARSARMWSKRSRRADDANPVEQGPWSRDHAGFEFRLEHILGRESAETLADELRAMVSTYSACPDALAAMNTMPPAEKFRALQIGLVIDDFNISFPS